MKSPLIKRFILIIILAWAVCQHVQLLAQAKKQGEEGTIKLRIEKQKDGKTEIIEKTYKADEWPGSFPESIFFNFSDGFNDFSSDFQMQLDSAFPGFDMPEIPNMSFHFRDGDSTFFRNEFFFQKGMDSLLRKHKQMAFEFNHELRPSLDSMMNHLRENQHAFKFQFENKAPIDSLLNKGLEGMKNFQFNWSDDFDGKGLNLMLDKEQYTIEETEDASGKKMIRITPKAEKNKDENTSARNSENRMQPSASQLNLTYNPTNKHLTVGFTLPDKGNTTVTITGPKGKEVFKDKLKNFSGNYKKEISLKANGLYMVKVTQGHLNITEKIEVE